MRVAFCQPIIPKYRSDFIKRFSEETEHEVFAYTGNVQNSKLKKFQNYKNINGFNFKKLWTFAKVIHVGSNHYFISFYPSLIWHLLKFKPQVIVTEGEIMILNNIFIILYAKLFGVKIVWWSLGKVVTRKKTIVNKLFDGLITFQIKSTSYIVGKNSWAIEYYKQRYGFSTKRMVVAPNTIDDKDITKDKVSNTKTKKDWQNQFGPGPYVLFVGAMEKTKNLEQLIDAMQIIWEQQTEAKLILVGDGEHRKNLERIVQENTLESKVIFTGKILEGSSWYFLNSDVFVLPGLGGLAIPHAMMLGLPVIARIADGTEKDLVINDETGYLLESQETEDLSQAILKILNDPELKKKMSHKCLKIIAENWNMGLQISRMEHAIEVSYREPKTIGKIK